MGASIFGAARLRRHAVDLSLWVLAGAAAVAVYSPIYTLPRDVSALGSPLVSAKTRALSFIPAEVPVSVSDQLGAHLSDRRYSYTFPVVGRSQWIVVDANDPTYDTAMNYKRGLRKYETDKAWRIVFASHGVSVLRKRLSRDG